MRAHLIILIASVLSIGGFAQEFPGEVFHKGEIMLNDGSIREGQLKYDLEADVVFFVENDVKGISTFNANQFKSFRLASYQSKPPRFFYTLPFRNTSGYRRPKIFEALHEDKVSLIGREYIIVKSRPVSNGFFRRSIYDPFYDPLGNFYTSRYLAYNLYLVDQEGGIQLLGKTRNDVIHTFQDHHHELRKYIKKEKLRMDDIEDLTNLVKYYNQLDNL